MSVTRDDIVGALSKIVDPGSGRDLVAADMVKALSVSDQGVVSFIIEVDPALGEKAEPLRAAAQAAVEGLPGVSKVTSVLTAHSAEPTPSRRSTPKG
ncbi:MAG TPA: iron-sulfur cluster assembly protein, partial [Paracoccaceae bacterium]|nr:iron-sulfur cluster assembly protein [Paracoccaceae bacterium]